MNRPTFYLGKRETGNPRLASVGESAQVTRDGGPDKVGLVGGTIAGEVPLRVFINLSYLRPEFREQVATEAGLFKLMLNPIGPNPQETKVP